MARTQLRRPSNIYIRDEIKEAVPDADERAELLKLRKEVKELRMEKEILKKASALLLRETK